MEAAVEALLTRERCASQLAERGFDSGEQWELTCAALVLPPLHSRNFGLIYSHVSAALLMETPALLHLAHWLNDVGSRARGRESPAAAPLMAAPLVLVNP